MTGPEWLFEMFDGFKNSKGTAMLKPVRDKYDRPIIGKAVLNDPDWEFVDKVTSPTNETKHIIEFLTEIPYEPKEIELDVIPIVL